MISGLISIGIFLIVQLVAAVWWAGCMSTKMDFVIKMSGSIASFSTKAEVNTALVVHEKEVAVALSSANKELAAMWKQIDKLNGKV